MHHKLLKKTSFAALFTLILFSGCNRGTTEEAGGEKLVIGATMLSMQNEFIVNIADEMQKKADELGVELVSVDAERSALKQVEQVESFIAQGVDAIILNPCEVEASSAAVQKAKAANIPIINVNSATSATPNAFVGSDDVESGRIAMKHIAEKLGGKGNVFIIHGYMGQAAQLQRDKGAKEVLKEYPNIKLVAEQTGEWDRAKAMSLTENWIQSHGNKIDAIFAHNDEMGMGAVKALENANLNDKVIVVSIDAIADAVQAVQKGRLDATVFQNAQEQGSKAIETAVKIAKGEQFDKEVMVPFKLITQANVAEIAK
ncbi:sugar ABC transporter substrate-binding protein [Adhaeribacter rhizoryzae]|uniref:Sugar ABC transporter substrate-binding protein n=1 Tax=Adhaeribacter rhizoryzae TaxID=2607907 RepID=A0A5M6D797_9BACT|nr:sugar ABC transporter substrate-binding protein [Adhaeribacter rhizoryzae]KAA5542360.1 sugar ABC transporter substrate-binding protein [Adhaeribacter rhizoryzae]